MQFLGSGIPRRLVRWAVLKKRKQFDTYKTYKRTVKHDVNIPEPTEDILITPIACQDYHFFEGLFARKAMFHGRRVHILCCGGYLSACESFSSDASHPALRKMLCQAEQDAFADAFGVVRHNYADEITAADEVAFAAYADHYFATQGERHSIYGAVIDDILYSALQRYYLMADPAMRDDDVTRRFLHTVLATITVMDRLCKRIKPKYVMTSHGIYSAWGGVLEYCKANCVPVFVYGRSYNKAGMQFVRDESILRQGLLDKGDAWKDTELSAQDEAMMRRFYDERLGRVACDTLDYDYNKGNKRRLSKSEIYGVLGAGTENKLVGMFPNIPWDGQVTGESAVFPQFRDWLRTTIEFFARQENTVLVIRSHPAELVNKLSGGRECCASMLREMYPVLPSNVLLLPPNHPVNSFTLGENCDFGLCYSSTVALELTYMGTPVIVAGVAAYSHKGIVAEIASREDYLHLLEQGMRNALAVTTQMQDNLLRFTKHYFFAAVMPERLMDIKNDVLLRFRFQTESEMDQEPAFDHMFQMVDALQTPDFFRFYTHDEVISE